MRARPAAKAGFQAAFRQTRLFYAGSNNPIVRAESLRQCVIKKLIQRGEFAAV